MTVAQALMSNLATPSSSARPAPGAEGARGGASFRDTLDKASQDGSHSFARSAPADEHEAPRGGASDASGEAHDQFQAPQGVQDVSALSVVLAVLKGEAGPSHVAVDFTGTTPEAATPDAVLPALGGGLAHDAVAGKVADGVIWMPGQVRDAVPQVLDGDRLLTLLSVDSASDAPDLAQVGADGMSGEIKATVTVQETHLAREATRADVLARLADVELGEAANGRHGGEVPEPPAASMETAEAPRQVSAQARSGVAAVAPEGERRGERGGVISPPGPEGRAVSQPALSGLDRGAAGPGGEGRASHGGDGLSRGAGSQANPASAPGQSSSGSSGETGVFMALTQGAGVQAAKPLGDDPGLSAFEDPVSDQIAKEVRAELRASGVGETSSEGVVKVLQLELKPANLGAVTVRIALKDNAISVHIEAQRRETVVAIEREREALLSALSASGYTVDAVSAAPQGESARAGGQAQGLSTPGGAPFQAPAGQQGSAGSSGGQGRPGEAAGDDSAYHGRGGGKDVAESGVRSDANGLYV